MQKRNKAVVSMISIVHINEILVNIMENYTATNNNVYRRFNYMQIVNASK